LISVPLPAADPRAAPTNWGSAVKRDQIRDCVGLMGKLVPLVIEIMMDHPETLWGDACYPVVE
jgi:hypothetical protein